MILTKREILHRIGTGHIVFDGDMRQVQENSINFTIGPKIETCVSDLHAINVVAQHPPYLAVDLRKPRTFLESTADMTPDGQVHIIRPGRHYIARTVETVGTALLGDGLAFVPEMRARSTLGRHGLTVALCAGMGDVGYAGRWAVEIVNLSGKPVALPVGAEIGQFVFHTASSAYPEDTYAGEGRYQDSDGAVRFTPKTIEVRK